MHCSIFGPITDPDRLHPNNRLARPLQAGIVELLLCNNIIVLAE
jgi:hypothetical protein